MLLGNPEKVFILSNEDVKKIFDAQSMNKPDEWMFTIENENGDNILKFAKKDGPRHNLKGMLNQWNQIVDSTVLSLSQTSSPANNS